MKEHSEQYRIVRWLRRNDVLHCHVPNGGFRNRIEAARFRHLGVEPGVPDLLIFDPPPAHPESVGTALEVKREKGGHVSEDQARWLEELRTRGWEAQIVSGWVQAVALLRELGYG